jgi:hypothetical protein
MSANREQRRKLAKDMGLAPGERLNLSAIMVQFDNGKAMYLDTQMVQIIDKNTGEPLFQEVLEALPNASLPTSVTAQQPAAAGIEDPPASPAQEFPDQSTQSYQVEFDTPEGKMVFVKNGNWSGVKPA